MARDEGPGRRNGSGEAQQGAWVDVHPIPGAVVVNAGDLLARWSNDRIRSTRHRVVEMSSGRRCSDDGAAVEEGEGNGDERVGDRYSIAYFCNPNTEQWIEALPGTWEEDGMEKRYQGVRCGDYLVERLSATY